MPLSKAILSLMSIAERLLLNLHDDAEITIFKLSYGESQEQLPAVL
jgi:hypothetical protein